MYSGEQKFLAGRSCLEKHFRDLNLLNHDLLPSSFISHTPEISTRLSLPLLRSLIIFIKWMTIKDDESQRITKKKKKRKEKKRKEKFLSERSLFLLGEKSRRTSSEKFSYTAMTSYRCRRLAVIIVLFFGTRSYPLLQCNK